MTPQHTGARLRRERAERGLSQSELARLVLAALPADDHQRPSVHDMARYVRRWEAGKVGVSNRYQRAYAAALKVDRAEIFGTAYPGTVETDAPVIGEENDEVKRRELMRDAGALSASAAFSPVLSALTNAWQSSQPRLPGATVSRAMIDDWAAGYDTHLRSYAVDAPQVVLSGLSHDWAEMAPHLAHGQPQGVERDLAHAAARHAYLIAAVLSQLGNRRQAQRWWGTSHRLADKSGDNLLAAYALSWEVTNRVLETPDRYLGELLRLAQESRRRAGNRATVQLIYATTVQAEVVAFMGHHEAATSLIRQAEEKFDQIPSSQRSHEEMLRFDQSLVYSLAGLSREADEAQTAAHKLYRPESDLYTSTQISLHGPLLQARSDPSEAGRQAVAIISALPSERRVKRIRLAGRRVLDAMPEKARSLPDVLELRTLTDPVGVS